MDWILIEGADAEVVRRETLEYLSLHPGEARHVARVRASGPDRFSLRFEPPLPPYLFTNLLNWLHRPGSGRSACGWIAAPASGVRYAFRPDPANESGDTLLGRSSEGRSVELYLPEGGLCETGKEARLPKEPALGEGVDLAFEVATAPPGEFGNPGLVITNPKDHDWEDGGPATAGDPLALLESVWDAVAYYRITGATPEEIVGWVDFVEHARLTPEELVACLDRLARTGRASLVVGRWFPTLEHLKEAERIHPRPFDPSRDAGPFFDEENPHRLRIVLRLPHPASKEDETEANRLAAEVDEALYGRRAGEVVGFEHGPGTLEILVLGRDAAELGRIAAGIVARHALGGDARLFACRPGGDEEAVALGGSGGINSTPSGDQGREG